MDSREMTLAAALALLGLPEDADRDAVTRAYRRLARTTHPDHSDAADAATRFGTLTAAYHQALDAAPIAADSASAASPVLTSTTEQHHSTSPVRLGFPRVVGTTILVGPARVDPSPSRGQPRRW